MLMLPLPLQWKLSSGTCTVPHEQWYKFASVGSINHSGLLRDVEMDDFLFEVFVIQQPLKILPEKMQTHTHTGLITL